MKRNRRQLAALLTLMLLAGLTAACGLWLRAQQRQYALNRALITVLCVKGDYQQALALVNEGADPNTRYEATPILSPPELVKQMLHRSPPPANDSETALSIACGGYWNDDITTIEIQDHRTDDAPLVQAMLLHSATVNVKDEIGCTPLMWTAWSNRPKAARLLLEHGASINARDEASRTPLMYAAMFPTHTDMVRLLLEHGADVNAQDKDGKTALYYAVMEPSDRRIMRELLAHGANPNLVDKNGLTPLTWAQQANRPNLIALLKQYGAKEPAKRP